MSGISDFVTSERRGSATIVHLDDGKANALSKDMIAAIRSAIDEASADPDVSAVVLHGRPGKFSAGFDLSVMTSGDLGAVVDLVADGGDLVHAIYAAPVPVVAACTGHALAAGALMLLACDVRVGAAADCKIGLNEVAIGMVLPRWALTIATERLSRRHLQRAVATARVTDGTGAVDAGFLDEAVPADAVLDRAVEVAEGMAALDRTAYAGTVRALRTPVLDTMAAQILHDRDSGTAV